MANRDLIRLQRTTHNTQVNKFIEEMRDDISEGEVQDEGTILHKLFTGVRDVLTKVGKQTLKKRYVHPLSPPKSSDINDTFKEVHHDTRTMFSEQELVGQAVRRNFDFSITDRLRLNNRIQNIGQMVNDYIVTAKNTLSRLIVLRDSFISKDYLDMDGISNAANVNDRDGVVTLEVTGMIHRTNNVEDVFITSNHPESFPGNLFLIHKSSTDRSDEAERMLKEHDYKGESWAFDADNGMNNHPSAMFDDNSDTWYEHQMINFPPEHKELDGQTKGYGLVWSDDTPIYHGDKKKDELSMSFIVKLKEPVNINWLTFNPYFPAGAKITYRVDYAGTSMTNSNDYIPVYSDDDEKITRIRGDAQIADIEDFDRRKAVGKGQWIFPSREAQFIKLDVTCENSYDTMIGHLYWTVTYDEVTESGLWLWKKRTVETQTERIDGPAPNEEVLSVKHFGIEGAIAGVGAVAIGAKIGAVVGPVGFVIGAMAGFIFGSLFGSKTSIENVQVAQEAGVDGYLGWRWVVGARGIEAYTYEYANKSVLMTEDRVLPKAASEISLHVSESIPEEFYEENIKTKNDWIKYYISIDGGKAWTKISPLEHSPVGSDTENFSRKIIAVNANISEEAQTSGKTYLYTDGEVRRIKLMAEFTRPEDKPDMTPVLYDYEIRVLPKEVE